MALISCGTTWELLLPCYQPELEAQHEALANICSQHPHSLSCRSHGPCERRPPGPRPFGKGDGPTLPVRGWGRLGAVAPAAAARGSGSSSRGGRVV
eukprot:665862-Pelagomonas_calceolata.AAC.3